MKKLALYIFLFSAAVGVFTSCEDEEAVRVPELQEGATFRLQFTDPAYSFFNYDDFENAQVQFDVFTINQNIDSANIYLSYYSFSQDSLYGPKLFQYYEQSDFDSEGKITDITITPETLKSFFELPEGLITGGDYVRVDNEVVLNDGRTYPQVIELPGNDSNTLTPDIAGQGVQTSSFNAGFVAYIACPLSSTFAVGEYALEVVGGFEATEAPTASGTVELEVSSPIARSFDFTYFGFTDRTFETLLVCGSALVPEISSGLSCGGPSLTWKGATPPGTYDQGDDSVIVIEALENTSGACGFPVNVPVTFILTKVD